MKIKIQSLYLFAILLLLIVDISAQGGTLDPTFGSEGMVAVDTENTLIKQHKMLPNNQSIILTYKEEIAYLLKINDDGTLDESFGSNGRVNLNELIGINDTTEYFFTDFDFTLTEKIIVGLIIKDRGVISNNFISVMQFNTNGELNSAFGNSGIVKYQSCDNTDKEILLSSCGKIKATPDGGIIITTSSFFNSDSFEAYLLKLNSEGNKDLNFGVDGHFRYKYRTYGRNTLAVNSEGNIFYGDDIFLAKIFANGIIDSSFGQNGYYINNAHYFKDIDFQSDGKIIATTNYWGPNQALGSEIIRINKNGTIDTTFGENGKQTVFIGDRNYKHRLNKTYVTLQDEIITGGFLTTDTSSKYLLTLAKLNTNGNFVVCFGDSGKVVTDLYNDSEELAQSFVVNKDINKITVSAIRTMQDSSKFLVFARFLNSYSCGSAHFSGDVFGNWGFIDTAFVDGDITVPQNKSLIINPGTHVYFTGEYSFDVYGQLIANGTETDSIFFFADSIKWNYQEQKYHGHWYGLGFKNTDISNAPNSELSYINFKYANSKSFDFYNDPTGYEADSIGAPLRFYYSSNITVSNISINECKGYSLNLVHSSPHFSEFKLNVRYFFQLSKSSNAILKNICFEGGRIIIVDSNPTMDSLSFIGSYSPLVGVNLGGTISNSIFKDNFYSWKDGGGAFNLDKGSTLKFENVLFEGNKNTYNDGWYGYGGAGYIRDSSPKFINCQFINNYSYGSASAIGLGSNDYSHPWISTFENCLFVKNKAEQGQGTLNSSTNAYLTLINCTIADNTAPFVAGIANDSGTPNIITNSIIYRNGPNYDQQFSTHQTSHVLTYNIIQGNYYGRDETSTNIHDVDPLFRDTSANDYHLQSVECGYGANSPAIDAGDPAINDLLLNCATAGLGAERSDIGAYGGANNWWDKSVLPDCHFAGEVSGTWECETIYIDGDIIIPEEDTLRITENVNKVLITGPYQIKVKGVLLASGPEGARVGLTSEQLLFQGSDWKGIFFNNLNDKSVGISIIENCRFDYANKMDIDYQGGGAIAIYNSDNVIVRSSTFYLNQAKFGGAIYIENSDAHIEDCYFNLNGKEYGQLGEASATAGGGMYIKNSNPYLHKLYFIDNHSIGGGGALVLDNSSPTISNIMMVRNFTEGLGGAVQLINGASPKFVNMTTADNVAETAGGAFYLNPNSNPIIINSIMFDDTKPEIYLGGGTPIVTYSIIDSASTETYFGEGCADLDPYLTTDVEYRLSNNTCSYSSGNTAVSSAIDAGHPDSLDTELDCYAGLGEQRADLGYYGGRYSQTTVGVKDNKFTTEIPSEYKLMQNYPNPFNPTTTISFALPKAGMVSLKVYNILGEEVAELINREMNAGVKKINFDASHLSSGLYIYRISTNNFIDVKKMLLLK